MRHAIRPHIARFAILIASATAAFSAPAQDLTHRAIPRKWVDPFLPEDLPTLELKDYVKTDSLEKAKTEAFSGRYKLSLMTLAQSKNIDPVELALAKATALAPLGRRDEAIEILSAPTFQIDSRIQILRARILAQAGRIEEAIAVLKSLVKKDTDSIAAHYWLGNIAESRGDLLTAREAFAWFAPFVDKWQGNRTLFTNAEEVTLVGRGVDRWASLTSAYQTQKALHNVVLSMFLRAYDEIDRGYWPAHLAAADYYVSHDDESSALKEIQLAAKGNPNDIATLSATGRLVLAMYNFDAADRAIAAIREVDAGSIDADLLLTRSLLQQRRPTDAQDPVRRVLQKQPKHLEALGLLAASEALQLHDAKTTDVLKEVEKVDASNATAYLEVAEQLAAMRQYPRAAAMYRIAIERAPWWTTARNGLGLLYTQSGEEDFARITLDAAHSLDPFNHATTNYLRLLDDLAKFARKETAHFVVMYDAKKDPMIPEYFADYLESIYREVCGEYKCEPPVKTYIEVFPTHDAFSVRTTGSPWIGTVGASTGRVIALVAPRKGQRTLGSFNWSQVLRHEFTHTVTLAATDNRIAHWMTEGLAVVEERAPLRWEWVPMLYQAVNKKELFTMENLTWGFVRPKRPIDRQLAYAQSFWICQYIEDTWGHEAVLAMLEEFRQGKEQREVFPKILGKGLSEFQSDFFAWTEKQVAGWGYDAETSKEYAELRKQGEDLIKQRQYAPAVEVWEKIAALRPVDVLPHTRLAGLYLRKEIHEPDKLIRELKELHFRSMHDNIYAKKISRVYRDEGGTGDAVKFAMQAVYIDAYDMDAHELLAQLYEKSGNASGLARENRTIPVLATWLEDNKKGTVRSR